MKQENSFLPSGSALKKSRDGRVWSGIKGAAFSCLSLPSMDYLRGAGSEFNCPS
jgi:hypothetical protein